MIVIILKKIIKNINIYFLQLFHILASECFEDLINGKNTIKWPKANKNLLVEEKIDYVIQINGKKRAILNENRDIDQESLLTKIKNNKLSENI